MTKNLRFCYTATSYSSWQDWSHILD